MNLKLMLSCFTLSASQYISVSNLSELHITQFGALHLYTRFYYNVEIGTFNTIFNIVIIPPHSFHQICFLIHPLNSS